MEKHCIQVFREDKNALSKEAEGWVYYTFEYDPNQTCEPSGRLTFDLASESVTGLTCKST